MPKYRVSVIDRYLMGQFIRVFFVCLFTATSLFLVIDFFERTRVVIKEEASLVHFATYLLLKVPMIVHLMAPIAVLVGTLFSIARLSQLSEVTAMRACGLSVIRLVRPLLLLGLCISLVMFVLGETVVPWSAQRVEEIYNFDIRKKGEKGALSQENYWYRAGSKFYNLGLYDSRRRVINRLSVFELSPDFRPRERIDADEVSWESAETGWAMKGVIESSFRRTDQVSTTTFGEVPLVIPEGPKDFYKLRREPETMNYYDLEKYIEKLKDEGVPTAKYQADLAAKLSFPFVNLIVVMVAFPFAIVSVRSGAMTTSFIAGVAVGFSYYVVHAFILSLGAAELIAVVPAAWGANVILGCLGGYFLSGVEI